MKNSDFKHFKEVVMTASKENPVWFMGYDWIALTNNQINQLVDILMMRREIASPSVFNGHYGLHLPSGLFIWKEGE